MWQKSTLQHFDFGAVISSLLKTPPFLAVSQHVKKFSFKQYQPFDSLCYSFGVTSLYFFVCHKKKKKKKTLKMPSVTEPTRREAGGPKCKLLFINIVKSQAGSNNSKRIWHGQDTRVILGQAWVFDRRTISNRARQRDNPDTQAIIQERCKQSPNGKAKGESRKRGQESKH